MNRLLVVLLSAFDSLLAVAVTLVSVLAPLTLLWLVAWTTPDWAALWPTSAAVWQLGHLVPLTVTLPEVFVVTSGFPAAAATFGLSLAPTVLTVSTAWFAARSAARAVKAGDGIVGVVTGSVVVVVAAALIAATSGSAIARADFWQAILFPMLVWAVPAVISATITAWRDGGVGVVDRLRDWMDGLPEPWPDAPGVIMRSAAIFVMGMVAVGAIGLAVAVLMGGVQMIALYQTSQVGVIGAVTVTLAQVLYLPTLVTWAAAYVAGPGFSLGAGTAVSPAGTQLGVVPAIPVFGAAPPVTSPWLLTIVLIPILLGALAGLRARMGMSLAPGGTVLARWAVTGGIGLVVGITGAVAALIASGAIGPGRLAQVGPSAVSLGMALALESMIGAGIVLLTSRRVRSPAASSRPPEPEIPADGGEPASDGGEPGSEHPTEPLGEVVALPAPAGDTPAGDPERSPSAPRRPTALPPVD